MRKIQHLNNLEEWVFINGTDEKYSISSHSRIKSNGFLDSMNRFKPSKILTPQNNGAGYFFICLGSTRKDYVHRLVAEHFLPSENLSLHINHKDGDKSNNKPSNLEWVTRSENDFHKKRNLEWHRYPILDTETGIFYANAKELYEIFCITKNWKYGMWKSYISGDRILNEKRRFVRA